MHGLGSTCPISEISCHPAWHTDHHSDWPKPPPKSELRKRYCPAGEGPTCSRKAHDLLQTRPKLSQIHRPSSERVARYARPSQALPDFLIGQVHAAIYGFVAKCHRLYKRLSPTRLMVDQLLKLFFAPSFTMASAPDTTSIPGYTIFREGDSDSVAAHAMTPQGPAHPLGM